MENLRPKITHQEALVSTKKVNLLRLKKKKKEINEQKESVLRGS